MNLTNLKLKQYKSCANCTSYEFATNKKENWCVFGFPLEKLREPKFIKNRQQNDVDCWEHKPKFGCVQKQYYGSKKISLIDVHKISILLY